MSEILGDLNISSFIDNVDVEIPQKYINRFTATGDGKLFSTFIVPKKLYNEVSKLMAEKDGKKFHLDFFHTSFERRASGLYALESFNFEYKGDGAYYIYLEMQNI